ncbi:hypothetical protein EWM64_g6509 [Hericium alpestre]|uniref:Uncharacterized protein n=1 Tax=Hericium alpestre TaxID=135208 RepID=A0A4Y9ZTC9_9AGAM|nr:hypothetical protein EWM64_g6509 [Hericium alpestre]
MASGDGTSHHKITYEAWHVNLLVPSYDDQSAPPSHRTWLASVDQALDHTSETQVAGWKEHANDMSELLNASPLAQREGVEFKPDDFTCKIKGMHGDHASDQLKTAHAIEAWKASVTHMDLGWARMSEMPSEELNRISAKAIAKKVEAIGKNAWLLLDDSGQRQHIHNALSALALKLGVLSLADLPMEDQRELTFFVWGGCCMHKDLNSVKGGNDAMQAEWTKLEAQAPILLANKANTATIEMSSASDPAARLAIDVSTCGGVKLTSLVGAIFNNKDDKKGHQDVHRWYFEKVKRSLEDSKTVSVKFPSTSNTCFQSHCNAAGELVTYRKQYINFLEHTRDNKEKHNFNHIELNVYNGLRDDATITELAILVLYAQMITHPYMCAVRSPGVESVNLLDLGPLHRDLHSHITYIIDHPEILLESSGDETWKKASLDKQPWEDPKAVKAVFSLQPELPHLKLLLVAFLKGALETWNRFSAEIDPDGLIDTASPSEKILAHMPSTNDLNEGALGAMHVSARQNPNETAQNHSACAAFNRNDTQSFMDAKLEYSDHLYIMRAARRADASQAPKKFRDQLMERLCVTVQKKHANDEIRASKKMGLFEKLSATELVQDEAAMKRMGVKELDLQLEVYRVVRKDAEVPIKARLKNKKEKYTALVAAVARSKTSLRDSAPDLPSETGGITQAAKDVLMDEEDDDDVLYYQK